MLYTLVPKVDGQSLSIPCEVKGSKNDALAKANHIAVTMQILFPATNVTCGVRTAMQLPSEDDLIVAWADGRFIDGKTGNFVEV